MATVGGMASTNAHGMRAVKYGPTSAWVLGLELVLPDGQVIETGSVGSRAKQSAASVHDYHKHMATAADPDNPAITAVFIVLKYCGVTRRCTTSLPYFPAGQPSTMKSLE